MTDRRYAVILYICFRFALNLNHPKRGSQGQNNHQCLFLMLRVCFNTRTVRRSFEIGLHSALCTSNCIETDLIVFYIHETQ